MEIPEEITGDLIRRLRRIEGQVRGIQTVLSESRECGDAVTRIAVAGNGDRGRRWSGSPRREFGLVGHAHDFVMRPPPRQATWGPVAI